MKNAIYRFILISLLGLFAVGNAMAMTETLQFNATIPEDHGIVYPSNALRMDHLLFRINDVLVEKDGIAEVTFDWIHNFITVDIVYYGNLSTDYDVILVADSNSGWISKDDPADYIPISVYFNEYQGENGIKSSIGDSPESIDIYVPASGPRRGQKVAEMIVYWEPGLALQPGYYDMDLNLSLWSR